MQKALLIVLLLLIDRSGVSAQSDFFKGKQMKIDSHVIEKLFEDSKSKLKEEYESFITKIKEDLTKTRQQTLYKIKRI